MNNLPIFYDYGNVVASSVTPSTVHSTDNALSAFFQKYLLQKAISVFKWELPKSWDRDYFLYTLYCNGFAAVINTAKFGVIPQHCGVAGYNVFYRPNKAIITNPLLEGVKEFTIGADCVLFHVNPNYSGIMDIVIFYADMMALCAQTAGVNLWNSKLSYIFAAKNKSAAESFKKMYDKIASGEPMAVVDKALYNEDGTPAWGTFQQNVGQNYIAGELLEDLRKWEQMFDTEIGIPNANTEKKERITTDEIAVNNAETASKCELWLESFQKSCEEVGAMFPDVKMSVNWRVAPETKGATENGVVVDTGSV